MKFLFDLLPVILFFIVFKWGEGHADSAQALATQYLSGLVAGGAPNAEQSPILLATAVAILVTIGQIAYILARGRKVDTMLWVSLAIITVFGGATIYFHNETFIKWKPTVLYWCIAGAFLLSQAVWKKNLVRSMMEGQISLPDAVWQRLSLSYVFFFLVMGVLNLFVAYNFSTSAWVNFKLFGGMGLMLAFVVAQSVFLAKYVQDSK
jgi:intracellular septation protein